MNILGISAYAHESSACLLKEGRPVALVEEERFNRERHTAKFPHEAIRAVLEMGEIEAHAIDGITFFWKPWKEIVENVGHLLRFFPASLHLLAVPSGSEEATAAGRLIRMMGLRRPLSEHGALAEKPVYYVEHHLCHAASAFFVSPFEEAAILTLDGRGERATTVLSVGRGARLDKVWQQNVPHSLGHLYAAVTSHLGFRPFCDEWKVMALAAHATPAGRDSFVDLLRLNEDGGFELDLRYFSFHVHGRGRWVSSAFIAKYGPPRLPEGKIEQRHCDLAGAVQDAVEKAGLHLARRLRQVSKSPRLCLAGGVALNCLMNKALVERGPFREVFIQPLANDAGTSLGSALYHHHQILGRPRTFVWEDVYLGPAYSEGEMEQALQAAGLGYRKSSSVAAEAARRVAEGKIVGWFQGRMEAGPRALGNRSILADARRSRSRDILNKVIKKREWFRPFAPAVLAEKADMFFNLKGPSPHMMLAADVKEEKKGVIPAVVHADGTARVQTVTKSQNPLFWELLVELDKLTGVPVVLNTSFNENEPIVCSPEQAIDCFRRSGMDLLVLGNCIVERTPALPPA